MAEMEHKVEQYRLANAESIIRNEARRCGWARGQRHGSVWQAVVPNGKGTLQG